MRIDLRYPIIVLSFYAPGLMVLVGAWTLGYSTLEARELVGYLGAILGFAAVGLLSCALFIDGRPIWLTIWEHRHDR